MKINIDTKKGAEAVSNILAKTSDMSKKAVEEVQRGAVALSEKAKQDSWQRRLKKYNPLFPDVYTSNTFNLPNMIMIVDDAVRRDIDVCEGAIGWLSSESGMEVLYLYDKAVAMSGLHFVPSVTCDAVYYVDSFSRDRFIRTDCIFSKSHEERLAELKHVAYSLGAKSCSIEISESSSESIVSKKKYGFTAKSSSKEGPSASNSFESNASSQSSNHRTGKITAQFEGNSAPKRPKLKWFINDENIKNLIEIRCKGNNAIKSETLTLAGSSSATMSQKTASAIDGAVSKMGIKGNSALENQAIRENHSTLIFSIDF